MPRSEPRSETRVQLRRSVVGVTGFLLLLSSFVFAGEAEAEGGIDLGAAVGLNYRDGDIDLDLDAISLRGHRWLGEKWGIEGSLATYRDRGFFDLEEHFLDLSAMYRATHNERFSTILFTGVGALDYQNQQFNLDTLTFDDLGNEIATTLHAGVAIQLKMGERLYFRPELRYRRHFETKGEIDDESYEATVGFGWTF